LTCMAVLTEYMEQWCCRPCIATQIYPASSRGLTHITSKLSHTKLLN
ncbi:hypothetical protein BAE44_0005613, partial [Dichanthelium oligosanthes]